MTKKTKPKYRGIKKCSLPVSYNESDTFKWVFNDDNNTIEYNEIYEAFSHLIKTSLEYNYEITYKHYDALNNSLKSETITMHSHNFNDVIETLYYYPESFNIPEEFQNNFSKQELVFLKRTQNYLLLIGLKDKTDSKEMINLQRKYKKELDSKKYLKEERKLERKEILERANNKKVRNYHEVEYFIASDNILNAILNKEKNTRIFREYSYSTSRIKERYFILDNDYNYKALVEITDENIIPLKDLKVSVKEYRLNGAKSLAEYKEKLFNYFKEDTIEEFTEDSLISVATFKIIEKY